MAVKVFKERKALVLQWNAGEYAGPVLIATESEDDVSSTRVETNPGFAAVTFPLEYAGKTNVTVYDSENNVIDKGSVSID